MEISVVKSHRCPSGVVEQFKYDNQIAVDVGVNEYGLIASPNEGEDISVYFHKKAGLWALSNGEYGGIIYFCPWCGEKLL